jgi:DNA polymerase elongation subunit (family B)
MIVTKEQIDSCDSLGNPIKELIISYINADKGISFLKWQIPEAEMFEWGYTSKANAEKPFEVYDNSGNPVIDEQTGKIKIAQWKSYDNKWIKKIPTTRNLSETRLNELLNKLCLMNPQINTIFSADKPDAWFCDIEVDVSPDGFPDAEHAAMSINTIAITKFPQTIVFARKNLTQDEISEIQNDIENYSTLTKNYKFDFRYFDSEIAMLEAFIDFITPIPAITGWNFLGYDWKYIFNRCSLLNLNLSRVSPTQKFVDFRLNRKLKIECKLPAHKIIYDYLQLYQMWDNFVKIKENDTLDWVAEKILGIKKVEHEWGFAEFYKYHYKEYVFYNVIDTILVEKIHEKIKTSDIWYMLASELKIELNSAFSTIKPCETVMTNFLYPSYKVIVNKKKQDEVDADYEGAFVWETQPGVYKYIGGLDFASLYPSIMRQFQISPESFLFKDTTGNYKPKSNEIKTTSGAVYQKDPDAVMPAILTHYFNKRKHAKYERKCVDTDCEYLTKIYESRLTKKAQ